MTVHSICQPIEICLRKEIEELICGMTKQWICSLSFSLHLHKLEAIGLYTNRYHKEIYLIIFTSKQ